MDNPNRLQISWISIGPHRLLFPHLAFFIQPDPELTSDLSKACVSEASKPVLCNIRPMWSVDWIICFNVDPISIQSFISYFGKLWFICNKNRFARDERNRMRFHTLSQSRLVPVLKGQCRILIKVTFILIFHSILNPLFFIRQFRQVRDIKTCTEQLDIQLKVSCIWQPKLFGNPLRIEWKSCVQHNVAL